MATASDGSYEEHVANSQYWNSLMRDFFGARSGGAIILIDAENARKGVAKTSCAVAHARLLSEAFGYELKESDFVLSGNKYLKRYQEQPGHEQPSVIVLDEVVGAGAGDKRRAMAQQNIDLGRAWQMLRTKRVVTIGTLPNWNQLDKRLKKLADYRVWCRENPIGTCRAYKVTVPFDDNSNRVDLKGLRRDNGDGARPIQFPNMDALNDPHYRFISQRKDDLIESDSWDADENADIEEEEEEAMDPDEAKKREAIRIAIRLYEPWDDDNELSYHDVAKVIDNYRKHWVGKHVRRWKNGEHRDLVPDPRETAAIR